MQCFVLRGLLSEAVSLAAIGEGAANSCLLRPHWPRKEGGGPGGGERNRQSGEGSPGVEVSRCASDHCQGYNEYLQRTLSDVWPNQTIGSDPVTQSEG